MKDERKFFDFPLILVTGATGYIASRLIPRLLDSATASVASHVTRFVSKVEAGSAK